MTLVMKELSNYVKHSNQILLSLGLILVVTKLLLHYSHSIQATWIFVMKEQSCYLKHSNQIHLSLTSVSTVKTFLCFIFLRNIDTVNQIDIDLIIQVGKLLEQNKKIWREIHACIQANDLEQLKTLLSKRTIINSECIDGVHLVTRSEGSFCCLFFNCSIRCLVLGDTLWSTNSIIFTSFDLAAL
jgi:hypothetical protein